MKIKVRTKHHPEIWKDMQIQRLSFEMEKHSQVSAYVDQIFWSHQLVGKLNSHFDKLLEGECRWDSEWKPGVPNLNVDPTFLLNMLPGAHQVLMIKSKEKSPGFWIEGGEQYTFLKYTEHSPQQRYTPQGKGLDQILIWPEERIIIQLLHSGTSVSSKGSEKAETCSWWLQPKNIDPLKDVFNRKSLEFFMFPIPQQRSSKITVHFSWKS